MPRESTPLVRKSGFLEAEKFYILAYEGDVTEKKYFEDLRQSSMFNDSGSIETIPLKKEHNGGNSPLDVKKLLSKAKAEYNFRATDEFWLIIDKMIGKRFIMSISMPYMMIVKRRRTFSSH